MKTEFLQSANEFADQYSSLQTRLKQSNKQLMELRELAVKIANKNTDNSQELTIELVKKLLVTTPN